MGVIGWSLTALLCLSLLFVIGSVFVWWCRTQQRRDLEFRHRHYTWLLIKERQRAEPDPPSESLITL
ncbi:unnamed protein product [Bursaphelenchus xylophilus]|uniref:(pine wood nematode) hypothetical protein n=1 Tax=Bursaphelenchus xylophilus TaxID=6326 RepID=A0A7I8WXT5_BURXY|nr:unnamed protein product [Bursaphelenchus xylophilus]CAG9100330.1 unnamed protein product [Bursaphelenchus xylophilus]